MSMSSVIPGWVAILSVYIKKCDKAGVVPLKIEEYKKANYPVNLTGLEIKIEEISNANSSDRRSFFFHMIGEDNGSV